jgi:hypothetical protein
MTAKTMLNDLVTVIDKAIDEITVAKSAGKADALSPDFKPNKNLGEGKATQRNLAYRQELLTLLKDTVYTPVNKMLDKKSMASEDRITFVDNSIDSYISKGWSLIDDKLPNSYFSGLDEGNAYIKKAAKKQGYNYSVKTPKIPVKLEMIINIQKRSLEDKALVLRGRLRSAIDTESWMKNYGS